MSEEYEEFTPLQKQIAAMIVQFPQLGDSDIAEKIIIEEGARKGQHPSKSYVNKVRKRLGMTPSEKEAQEPQITVGAEETEEEGEQEQEEEEEEPEEKEAPEPWETPEQPTLPTDEQAQYQAIFQRSMKRLGDTIIARLANVKDGELSSQDAEDSGVLALALISKYSGLALDKYYLEVTSVLHFGSLAIEVIAKKRQQQEEKPIPQPETPTTPKEEKPPETKVRSKYDPTNRPAWAKSELEESLARALEGGETHGET